MTTHKPGRWFVDDELIVRDEDRNEVAFIAIGSQLIYANDYARLIAAAPDMLAALKDVERHISPVAPGLVRELARAAIAKAEGKP